MRVRLTPNAKSDRIIGMAADENGEGLLRVAVTAIAENGKANKALIKFLAKQWCLSKSSITLVSGVKERLKILHIEENAGTMINELEKWAAQVAPPSR